MWTKIKIIKFLNFIFIIPYFAYLNAEKFGIFSILILAIGIIGAAIIFLEECYNEFDNKSQQNKTQKYLRDEPSGNSNSTTDCGTKPADILN